MKLQNVNIYYMEQKFPVKLKDFMFVEHNSNKVLLLKFNNSIGTKLISFSFEVKFKNDKGEVIETKKYQYMNCNVKGDKEFIPKKRITVLPSCVDIEYTLLRAEFAHCLWENGEYKKLEQVKENEDGFIVNKEKKNKYLLYYVLFTVITFIFIIYYYNSFGSFAIK